jgi:hypothetical protein
MLDRISHQHEKVGSPLVTISYIFDSRGEQSLGVLSFSEATGVFWKIVGFAEKCRKPCLFFTEGHFH